MALVRNIKAESTDPNEISLFWDQPLNFNLLNSEIILTKTDNHFPVELFNAAFPDRATDSRPIEIFRGKPITGTALVYSLVGDEHLATDLSASFPTLPPLNGRLLRDSSGKVVRILSNTSTQLILDSSIQNGTYVILADFPFTKIDQRNFEFDVRTVASLSAVSNFYEIKNGSISSVVFTPDSLANLIFKDANNSRFVIKSNTSTTITLFEAATPVMGPGMAVLPSFNNSDIKPYKDVFKNQEEATLRVGTRLLSDQFYYYTAFCLPIGTNVAQASYSTVDSEDSTQASALSLGDYNMGAVLYNYWPTVHKTLDETADLEDLMKVFGFQFNEIYSLIKTYRLQDSDKVFVNALLPLSEQTGLPSVGFSIGTDTLRRIARDLITCWKLKGSKEGIALFIKVITTWDITNGSADFSGSISDFLPNVQALRLFDENLGSLNTKITKTDPIVSGGKFVKSLPGVVIPGFFTFREFIINIPNIALFVGSSTNITTSAGTTTIVDSDANYGGTNNLVGTFIIPNQGEVNDIFKIVANTSTSVTVSGIINNRTAGGEYAILSPLNTNRFIILNTLLPGYIPVGTKAGFRFIIT